MKMRLTPGAMLSFADFRRGMPWRTIYFRILVSCEPTTLFSYIAYHLVGQALRSIFCPQPRDSVPN
eukprot:SAG11_NODE_25935_length_352_cov_0.565217_1_plen_65_part_10